MEEDYIERRTYLPLILQSKDKKNKVRRRHCPRKQKREFPEEVSSLIWKMGQSEFQSREDNKKLVRGKKKSWNGKSILEAQKMMEQEGMDLQLTTISI